MKRSSMALGAAALLAVAAGYGWLATGGAPPATLFGRGATPKPRVPVASPWTPAQLRDLLDVVRAADHEGLRPSDYRLAELEQAAATPHRPADVTALANTVAAQLAHDFAAGRVTNRHRFNWYIDYAGPDAATLARQLAAARARGELGGWLRSLLPASADYTTLRTALAQTPADDDERRNRIIANMERWRWLARDFGQGDQLYVNLPTYELKVITAGAVAATYRAVIGAIDMPTPVLSAPVRQVIANPDWIVPASIVRKSHLRPGGSKYIFSKRPDGTLRVRQKPGPGNALGRVKIEFPNRLAIYFHDTPSKSLFGASTRAFSHGCVRVQNIDALASSIVAQPDRFVTALAGDKTRSFRPAGARQANIVYLTLVRDADGTLADVGDPYGMDEALAAALQGRKPKRAAPPPLQPVKPPAPAPRAPQPAPKAPIENDAPAITPDDGANQATPPLDANASAPPVLEHKAT